MKFAWQRGGGNYLAITGYVVNYRIFALQVMLLLNSSNKVVNIYDRHGEHKSSVLIVLPGYVFFLKAKL